MPPESGPNDTIANRLFFGLVATGIVPLELVRPGKCEVQVPVLRSGDAANRFPDLVVLDVAHLDLTQKRLTITLDMPPPRLVVEVMSPGECDGDRDLIRKRDQYAARKIPEYWLIDPEAQTVKVMGGRDGQYFTKLTLSGLELFASRITIMTGELTFLWLLLCPSLNSMLGF